MRRAEPITTVLPLTVSLNGESVAVPYGGYRVDLGQATVRLSATDSAGRAYPLLMEHRLGRGRVSAVPLPLFATYEPIASGQLVRYLFDTLLPSMVRPLTTDAPATVEVILRRKANAHIVHLVNRAEGQREELKKQYGWPYYRITDIPPVPPCRVSVRLPAKPIHVRVVPDDSALTDWTFIDGWLRMTVPQFAIHQLLVIT